MLSLTWERYPRWLYTGFHYRIFLLSPLWIRGACTSCKAKKQKPIIFDYWAGHLKGKRSNYWRKIKILVGQFGTFSWNMWSLDLFCNSKEWPQELSLNWLHGGAAGQRAKNNNINPLIFSDLSELQKHRAAAVASWSEAHGSTWRRQIGALEIQTSRKAAGCLIAERDVSLSGRVQRHTWRHVTRQSDSAPGLEPPHCPHPLISATIHFFSPHHPSLLCGRRQRCAGGSDCRPGGRRGESGGLNSILSVMACLWLSCNEPELLWGTSLKGAKWGIRDSFVQASIFLPVLPAKMLPASAT